MHKITFRKHLFWVFFSFLTFTLSASPLPLEEECELECTIKGTDVCCAGEATGKAEVTIIGGQAPFTYEWSNGIDDKDGKVQGLAAGTYSVTVTDCHG
ncbi:MAG: SprB repeat-containing protein, partial [Robiginitalea sp.]|nr:SprB repeat-containing protein [Robiginitalea sp.]